VDHDKALLERGAVMNRGQALAAAACDVIPGGLNTFGAQVGAPHAFTGADGAYVIDLDGRRYLDYHAGAGAVLLGYNHPAVNEAVFSVLGGPDHVGLGVTELEVELAQLIVTAVPSAEQVVVLTSGGEATAGAVRLARAATGRPLLMTFQGGGVLDPAGGATVLAELNRLDTVKALFADHQDRIAAVLVEPVAGVLDPSFLPELRALADEHGALLVFDESGSGFRHALGGHQQVCGVLPDLTVLGKAMGNGFPASGVAGRRDLMRRLHVVNGDGTFNGNRVTTAASVATIRHLRDHPEFYDHTHALGRRLRDGLRAIVAELGITAAVTGFGGDFALSFPPLDDFRDDDVASVAFTRHMTEAGILMGPAAPRRHHVTGAHTAADIDHTLDVARDVLATMRRQPPLR
jgi:glutamate-1-semialdehyde aminotransferase